MPFNLLVLACLSYVAVLFLVAFLAECCAVPKSAITIEMGASSRTKRVAVAGLDDAELLRRLAAST